jgi:GNAT superfamily N-acetyltransferase
MNKILIRDFIKVTDIGQIILWHSEYYSKKYGWNEEFEAYVAKALSEFVIRKDNKEKIWIIENESKVKGSVTLTKVTVTIAQLRWFFVDEELRGMGYGKKLMEQLLSFAKSSGYSEIILWTTYELSEAAYIYKKYGFELIEEFNHFVWGKEVTEQNYSKKI